MEKWQNLLILLFAVANLAFSIKGFYETKSKRNAYGLTLPLSIFGIFVWGDAVVFGMFWALASSVILILQDWYLFLLVISVFWVVRSLGETIYWLNQQFSTKDDYRTKPDRLPWHSVFHDDSVWFIYQIIMQCITVVSVIVSIYLTNLWLSSGF